MKFICFVAIFLSLFSHLTSKFVILPDSRKFEIPDPWTYSYTLEGESPASLERLYILSNLDPEVSLLCPEGYSLHEMKQELVMNESFHHLIPRSIVREQSISLQHMKRNDVYKKAPCPTAYHCLGYQACLFTYGDDLCERELIPHVEHYLLLNVNCFRDDLELLNVPKKFQKNKHYVLYIYNSPNRRNNRAGLYVSNVSHLETPEDKVFSGKCPALGVARQEGYSGNCSEFTPSSTVVSLELWSALGKQQSRSCRDKIVQTLCALHYNSRGLCVPPLYLNRNPEDGKMYNYEVFPEHKHSFHLDRYNQFLQRKSADLIPTRLAFVIMAKRNIHGTISLLESIYTDNFFYVIHVDKEEADTREELQRWIEGKLSSRQNLILLPLERSFSTTGDSYETVRANMECYHELLHLGIWDFVVTLNEDDTPLRNIKDLSMALAPYRGLSFLPDLNLMKNGKSTPVVSCEGVTHKFPSFADKFETKSNLILYNTSQNGIFCRLFVEFLINENQHSDHIKRQQFFLQTLPFSSRIYIPTILMNSKFTNSVRISQFRVTKKDWKRQIANESDHADEKLVALTRNISNGNEYFLEKDVPLLNKLAHNFYFGQKLSNSVGDNAQKFASELANGDYYQHLENGLPTAVIRALIKDVLRNISTSLKIGTDNLSVESVLNLQVVPSFVAHQETCRSKLISVHTQFNKDANYWFDVSSIMRYNRSFQTVRILLQPTISLKRCFEDGNLRLISLSPWYTEEHDNERSDFQENTLLPYFLPNIKGISFRFLVTDEVEYFIERGNIISLRSKNSHIGLNITLQSPKGERKCSCSIEIALSDKKYENLIEDDLNHKTFVTKLHSLLVPCNHLEIGLWTVKINQIKPRISEEYTLYFYVLDVQNQENLDEMSKNISSLWTLKSFAFLTESDMYDFNSDEIRQRADLTDLKDSEKVQQIQNISRKQNWTHLDKTKNDNLRSDKTYLFICGGGLISFFAVFLTIVVLLCGWRYRYHPKIVLCFILILCSVTTIQVFAMVSFCN